MRPIPAKSSAKTRNLNIQSPFLSANTPVDMQALMVTSYALLSEEKSRCGPEREDAACKLCTTS